MDLSTKILKASDIEVQRALREIDAECLVHVMTLALNPEATDKILRNMSERANVEIQKDLDDYRRKLAPFLKIIDGGAR